MVLLCSQLKWCDHILNNYVTHERKGMRYIQRQREHFAHICNANWSAHHIFSFTYVCILQDINRALTNQCINLLLTLITLEILKQIPVFGG